MLEVCGLTKTFGATSVLRAVDFSVRDGEIVGIMGESGAGKSTIARILCGAIVPDAGSAALDGAIFLQAGQPYRRQIGMALQPVPQQPFAALDPLQQAISAVREPLRVHQPALSADEARDKAQRLLRQVGLDAELFRRRPDELSGGQAQRVLIARCLTMEPRVLIADEATSMLDMTTQAAIVHLIKALVRERGIGCLWISHDEKLLKSVCHRILRLEQGRLKDIDRVEKEAFAAESRPAV